MAELVEFLFYAFLIAALISKLGLTLGRTDNSRSIKSILLSKINDNSGQAEEKKDVEHINYEELEFATIEDKKKIIHTLEIIRSKDPSFSINNFVNGAKIAYEVLINSFSEGNEVEIKKLVNESVFQDLKKKIAYTEEARKRTLISISATRLKNIFYDPISQNIDISLDFFSKQLRGSDHNKIFKAKDSIVFNKNIVCLDSDWRIVSLD